MPQIILHGNHKYLPTCGDCTETGSAVNRVFMFFCEYLPGAPLNPRTAVQIMICTKHTKSERLAKVENREPKAEGQNNVPNSLKSSLEVRMQARQSHSKPPTWEEVGTPNPRQSRRIRYSPRPVPAMIGHRCRQASLLSQSRNPDYFPCIPTRTVYVLHRLNAVCADVH
jgi:hypothetical protein